MTQNTCGLDYFKFTSAYKKKMTNSSPLILNSSHSVSTRAFMPSLKAALIFCGHKVSTAETHIQNLVVWLAELQTTVEFTVSPHFSCESQETEW